MSAFLGNQSMPGAMPGVAPPSQGAGAMRLFFELEQSIDAIASLIPAASEQLDGIKTQLRGILTSALQGAESTPPTAPGMISGGAGELVR